MLILTASPVWLVLGLTSGMCHEEHLLCRRDVALTSLMSVLTGLNDFGSSANAASPLLTSTTSSSMLTSYRCLKTIVSTAYCRSNAFTEGILRKLFWEHAENVLNILYESKANAERLNQRNSVYWSGPTKCPTSTCMNRFHPAYESNTRNCELLPLRCLNPIFFSF